MSSRFVLSMHNATWQEQELRGKREWRLWKGCFHFMTDITLLGVKSPGPPCWLNGWGYRSQRDILQMSWLSFFMLHGRPCKYTSLNHIMFLIKASIEMLIWFLPISILISFCFYTVVSITLTFICRTNQESFFKEISIIWKP